MQKCYETDRNFLNCRKKLLTTRYIYDILYIVQQLYKQNALSREASSASHWGTGPYEARQPVSRHILVADKVLLPAGNDDHFTER